MKIQTSLISLTAVALVALLAMPAFATGTFTVHLTNGHEFTTLRQPKEADWDESLMIILTDAGNWIAIPKDSVDIVSASVQEAGFGTILDSKTILMGVHISTSPIDDEGELNEDGEEAAETGAMTAILSRYNEFMDQLEDRTFTGGGSGGAAEGFTTEQFAEPGSGGGAPYDTYATDAAPSSGGGGDFGYGSEP